MIAEYKLYHGAVLAELVDVATVPITIEELEEDGRLGAYKINGHVGLYVKHSTQRLRPWPFTVSAKNLAEVAMLMKSCKSVFFVLVCHTDGMVCLTLSEVLGLLGIGKSDQAWLRVDRPKRKFFSVSGAVGEPLKLPGGVDRLVERLVPLP